jgi:uncharacterized protein (TIGR01777 family)
MKIVITGSTGLVGSALMRLLARDRHDVIGLRRPADWDPETGTINLAALQGTDAVVHLAGESIASGRWSAARKEQILQSRVKGTRLIAESISRLERMPRVLISASAIGYYGDRGSELLREDSRSGEGFLCEVCRQWEAATEPAAVRGIRVVCLRTGLVLSREGGALRQMLPPFKLGIAGKIGSGDQYWSWISIDDLCGAILHCLGSEDLRGPVNTVSPSPVTNLEFTKTLGRALRRPTVFPLPAFAARIVLGEMADSLLLASARVEPAKLLASRFGFAHTRLEPTLQYLLNRQ